MEVLVKRLDERATIPTYATAASAGFDLRVLTDEPVTIEPGDTYQFHTGLAIYLEDKNFTGLVFPRSGLGSKHGIVLRNLTGVIDADYQGELMVGLWNRSKVAYTVQPNERVAQYVIVPVYHAEFIEVDDFEPTERGTGGFGSSGRD